MTPTTEEQILVGKCAEAISRLGGAIRYPQVAVHDIQEAIALCQSALQAAKVINPDDD